MQAGALDAIRVLHIGPAAPGLPALDWVSELGQIGDVPGVRLELCLGKQAVRSAVAARLHEVRDCVLWSGHGAAGRLMLADGPVGADWLACMLKQQPPAVVVLAACFSGARDQALHSMAETISQAGITCIGMWAEILDPAAVVYNVEFVRAYATGAPVQVAHRVALEQLALEHPSQAGIAFLLPGLMNGYGRVTEELKEIRQRLVVLEQKVDALGR